MFEVQTAFIYGWENCWTTEDGHGNMVPEFFETREAAEEAIKELLEDVKYAVMRGDMEEEYDPEDYRVVEVKDGKN